MKDYLLKIKIQNNNLWQLMKYKNITTAVELSKLTGVNQNTIGTMLNLKITLYMKGTKKVIPSVQIIADFFKVLPEDIFPKQHYQKELKNNKIEGCISFEEVRQIASEKTNPLFLLENKNKKQKDLCSIIKKRLNENNRPGQDNREYKILCLRFGLNGENKHTLKECAEILNVGRERVRQIESQALRKLRHPLISDELYSIFKSY